MRRVPRAREQKLKGTTAKGPDMLTWTGPMLLFLPPGMPSSLIAERKQPNRGEELFSILEIHKKVSATLKKSFYLKRLMLLVKAVYTETSSASQGIGELEQHTPRSSRQRACTHRWGTSVTQGAEFLHAILE